MAGSTLLDFGYLGDRTASTHDAPFNFQFIDLSQFAHRVASSLIVGPPRVNGNLEITTTGDHRGTRWVDFPTGTAVLPIPRGTLYYNSWPELDSVTCAVIVDVQGTAFSIVFYLGAMNSPVAVFAAACSDAGPQAQPWGSFVWG
ncbi:hypothetical protein JAAARDRAFT_200822 [Jaapia argillacea MUCL 33604]|uniref:Uncharacterized protein n=1 Tax=Jaapia argillacea MUCL 33604 TaxID=933084 RepID=A0A067P414_9AGAM|nr:hypothetical protein JAAARDRAFT_200822 [Jaapia argillacea MUCL 33604]